ncbi:paraquat-inducible protein A [Mangrovicoccus algicola]|uniref:Paraquat-inducible protein A n=1 Tax=Mangrovicoccus algicola TaxID=2771008 RepID=A0A8J6YTY9_9RHOB|nr:paraquat-inducible protein A [Mangrovicoccus algicola]MBE3639213.1 paraquat-inducible protein A [Mangrovicoccus algicola]
MTSTSPDPARLVACPTCDTLFHADLLTAGRTATCSCCGTVIFAPRNGAIRTVLALAVAALVLMAVALGFPFLTMTASGLTTQASVIDAVASFAVDDMAPLSLAIGLLIVLLPSLRLCLLIYVTLPLALGRRPWPRAREAFRMNVELRPWSMAEIFMVGVAVAMVKVADMATISFGPAFWAMAAVATLLAAKDAVTCERTLWHMLRPA